jgi:hypothetical protein
MIDEAKLAVLLNDIKHIREDASEIKQQVIKTNGRVTVLEKWQHYLTGAWAVLTIFGTLLLAVMMKLL